MKEVLSQSIQLLRRHPILWLPQLCAMCLVLMVQKIYALAAATIWHILWHPSVTSSNELFGILDRSTPPHGVIMERSLLTIPLLLLANFVEMALCATACVVVAIFVSRIVRGLATDPQSALPATKQRVSGIAYLALVATGVFMVKLFIGFLLITWLGTHPGFAETPLWKINILDWAIDIVYLLAIVYFVVPIALSIVGTEESFLPSPQEIRWSRLFAAITIIVCMALQFGWGKVENHLIASAYDPTALWFFALSFVSTLISAAALTWLSTALAVTANHNSDDPPISETVLT
jgi:hypothetical protein